MFNGEALHTSLLKNTSGVGGCPTDRASTWLPFSKSLRWDPRADLNTVNNTASPKDRNPVVQSVTKTQHLINGARYVPKSYDRMSLIFSTTEHRKMNGWHSCCFQSTSSFWKDTECCHFKELEERRTNKAIEDSKFMILNDQRYHFSEWGIGTTSASNATRFSVITGGENWLHSHDKMELYEVWYSLYSSHCHLFLAIKSPHDKLYL